jgi:hypothetical protein
LVGLAWRLTVAIRRRDRRRKGHFTSALTIGIGGKHSEDTWAAMLPDALRWLFPP